MGHGTSVAEVRQHFAQQAIENLQQSAAAEAAALAGQGVPQQHRITPSGWSGDLFDLAGLTNVFSRAEIEEDFLAAIRDAAQPGTVGDLMACQLQGDYLAMQERAFRARHQTPQRLYLHAVARRRAHGHPGGVVVRGVLGQVENILRKSKHTPGEQP